LSIVIKRYAKPWATPIGLSERIHHIRVAQGHQQLTLGHTDVPQSALGALCPWPKVWQSVWNATSLFSTIPVIQFISNGTVFGRNQGRTLKTSRASSTQRARTACFVPTSDRNAGKVSEAQGFRGAPPTETWRKCRRSRAFEGYLRRKRGKSVGSQQEKEGTSDSFVVFLSEVTLYCCRPVAADGMRTRSSPRCSAGRSARMLRGPVLRGDLGGRC
jgi:hypothetical protein